MPESNFTAVPLTLSVTIWKKLIIVFRKAAIHQVNNIKINIYSYKMYYIFMLLKRKNELDNKAQH